MNVAELVWKVFSTGLVPVDKAPPECALLLDDGFLQITQQGKMACYCVAPKGYRMIVGF